MFLIVVKNTSQNLPAHPFLSVQFRSVKHVHIVVEQISSAFSPCQTNTALIKQQPPIPSLLSPWQPPFYSLCFCELDSGNSFSR